ncbi:MAG: glutamyl-tRNA reductase, partial [Lachnospiraceae bacterium]|nr:glutamyl-tRNA reductase [Lachnospiraceae bacterium]
MKMEREEIPLFVLSISHRQAPVEIRKQFSFDREQTRRFLSRMKEEPGVWGSVLVSTCNRTEVYFSGERKAVDAVQELLAGEKAADIRLLRRFFRIYQGQKAAEHLFRVTGGLDSMVLGEDEILGQIRTAYNTAREEQSADYYINALFQRALKSAKRIKTETCLSKSSVSIATLSAAQAVQFREGEKKVLLLGATGQMGSLIAKNLSGRKDIRLFAAVRRRCPAVFMENAAQIAYGERYSYIDQADIVISA